MAAASIRADGQEDDVFSFQEETMTIDNLQTIAHEQARESSGLNNTQLGLKSGWKSEKVSGHEIRERLSALAVSAPPPAVAEHAGESSSPLTSAWSPDDEAEQSIGNVLGSAFSKFHQADSVSQSSDKSKRTTKDRRAALEDRTADINTGGSSGGGVESWSGLLAPGRNEQQRTLDSWDIHEAEKLLATSPTSAKNKHVQLPLGLVYSVP